MKARLYALHMRLEELDSERHRTQVHVNQLESALEDARLAKIMGEDAGDPDQLGPELERTRGSLEEQQEVVTRVRKLRSRVFCQAVAQRVKERREERERAQGEQGGAATETE
jgi:hypothetical protein